MARKIDKSEPRPEIKYVRGATESGVTSYDVTLNGKPTGLHVQDTKPVKGGLALGRIEGSAFNELFRAKTWAAISTAVEEQLTNTNGVTNVSNLEIAPVNLTDAGKKWVNEQCKKEGLNVVGKTTDHRLCLLAEKRGEHVGVVSFVANGGKIEEVPGFTQIAPKKNSRETSAGGKVAPEEPSSKKAPRRIKKEEKSLKGGDRRDTKSHGRRADDPHTVSLQDLCEELEVEPRIARRKLRGSDIQKPGESWVWPVGHVDIQRVKDLIK